MNKTDKNRLESHLTAISLKKTDERPKETTGALPTATSVANNQSLLGSLKYNSQEKFPSNIFDMNYPQRQKTANGTYTRA